MWALLLNRTFSLVVNALHLHLSPQHTKNSSKVYTTGGDGKVAVNVIFFFSELSNKLPDQFQT